MPVQLTPLAPADAIAALTGRGRRLDPSFAWQDWYAADHARAFTVAKSAGFDILSDIYAGLELALKEGKTARQFAAELTPLLQAKGWWGRRVLQDPATGEAVDAQLGSPRRLQLIFDVNMRVSYAAGHWASFQRNKKARPFLRYVHLVGQEHPRLHHQALHNIVLPVDHPFWDTHFAPNGWNCHCSIQSLSQRDVDRLLAQGEKLVFDPPVINTRPWVNKRTGEVRHIPEGIDPGWDYNPGKAGYQATLAAAERLIDAPVELAAQLYAEPDWLQRPLGQAFGQWFDQATAGGRVDNATVVAGVIDRAILQALDTRPQSAAITVTQQVIQHMLRDSKVAGGRAVPAGLLRNLPDLLARPRAVLRDRRAGDLVYVFDVPGDPRAGKLVVRLDYSQRSRVPGGQREQLVTNAIRTAGLVANRNLADFRQYELLFGAL